MDISTERTNQFSREGFLIVPDVLDEQRIAKTLALLDGLDHSATGVMASKDLFAVRDVVGLVPELLKLIWSSELQELVNAHCGPHAFMTKSIYFDKPASSNWFVGYHQDISISVARRIEMNGFASWTNKHGVIGVIPPVEYLERTLTVRLHLDKTDGTNGALRVIPGSHRDGIRRDLLPTEQEVICEVPSGAAMLMRPLLFHASRRSSSNQLRRVLHLEFNDLELPAPMCWAERRELL